MVYSLLGSCKAAGVNPTEWLEDVLSKIYSYSKEKRSMEELLPHLWKKIVKLVSNRVKFAQFALQSYELD